MRRPRLLLALSSVALATALSASPVLAGTTSERNPLFAGYATVGTTFHDYIGAKATFTVPKLGTSCTDPGMIMIGAFVGAPVTATSRTIGAGVLVHQKGIRGYVGMTGSSPWGTMPTMAIRAGDRVQVRVSVARLTSKATFYIENYTTGARYSYTKAISLSGNYDGRSAFIGVYTGETNSTPAPIPNFGTLGISGANVQLAADGSWKTLGSRTTKVRFSLVNKANSVLVAPSAINTTTLNSFSMSYKACK